MTKKFVPQIRYARSLEQLADEIEYGTLLEKCDGAVDAIEQLQNDDGEYDEDRFELAHNAHYKGMELMQKAIRTDKHIYYVTANSAAGSSTFYFLAFSLNELRKKLKRLK